jgi:glutamate:GABA antiporter
MVFILSTRRKTTTAKTTTTIKCHKYIMNKKTLGVFALAMMNLAALGSVKNWPILAEYGFSSIFYFLLAACVFFIPTALVSAELATGWPKIGGIFIWVKEAFGHRLGFLAIWLLWVENVIWYPTILAFIATTITYIFNPVLGENKTFLLTCSLIVFWIMTYINLKGIKMSGWVSTLSVVLGGLLPGIFIITLGLNLFFSKAPLQIVCSWETLIPNMSSVRELVIFVAILLSLCGMEISAIHARDVKNPQKDYPKATFITILFVVGLSILGVLSIAAIVPQDQISLAGGSMQAITLFVDMHHIHWMAPILAFLIVLGAVGSLSTWIIGPSRGLLAAAQSGDLPPIFKKINRNGMPVTLLLTQALVVSFLIFLFIIMPTVNGAYWIISILVTQVYLIMYILMFAAAIQLRYSRPNVIRSYQIPGGKIGIWIVCGIGILSSSLAFIIGFVPPAHFQTGNQLFFIGFLGVGILLICLAPSIFIKFKKPSWNHKQQDDSEL